MLDPRIVAGLADAIGDLYSDSEAQLLATIARRIGRGLDSPRWAENQLAEMMRLRQQSQRVVTELGVESDDLVEETIREAYRRGRDAAQRDLNATRTGTGFSSTGVVDTAAVQSLAAETIAATGTARGFILRSTDDAYRRVVADVTGRVVTGSTTRQVAAQTALNRLAREGITGFVDRAGRRWQASSYVEMALRTSTGRSMLAGHSDRLLAAGHDLVLISSHPNPAPQCQPFEGRVVSLTGAVTGTQVVPSALDGSPVTVEVVASMAQAEAAGLHHPNCRHSHVLFVPGASVPPVDAPDPQGYEDSQRQRYLERGVRSWKRQEAVALDPSARERARAGTRRWQERAEQHSKETGIPRRKDRERVQTGNAAASDVRVRETADLLAQ